MCIIDVNKFSSYHKLLRTTAYVLKFVKISKGKALKNSEIIADEINEAETYLVKNVQKLLEKDPKFKDLRANLGLYKDQEGVCRCKSRINNALLPFETCRPILLPGKHHIVELIIIACHKRFTQWSYNYPCGPDHKTSSEKLHDMLMT